MDYYYFFFLEEMNPINIALIKSQYSSRHCRKSVNELRIFFFSFYEHADIELSFFRVV